MLWIIVKLKLLVVYQHKIIYYVIVGLWKTRGSTKCNALGVCPVYPLLLYRSCFRLFTILLLSVEGEGVRKRTICVYSCALYIAHGFDWNFVVSPRKIISKYGFHVHMSSRLYVNCSSNLSLSVRQHYLNRSPCDRRVCVCNGCDSAKHTQHATLLFWTIFTRGVNVFI